MSAVIIDGKSIAEEVKSDVAQKVCALKEKGITPCLAVILVGNNPASVSYVTGKRQALEKAGMADRSVVLEENTSEEATSVPNVSEATDKTSSTSESDAILQEVNCLSVLSKENSGEAESIKAVA